MTLEEESGRGAHARKILEDDLFKEAVAKVQQDVFDTFAKTDPKDDGELKIQRLRLKCLADVVRNLGDVMNTGKLAEKQIEEEVSLAQRVVERAKAGLRRVF
jgi:hypothetical protein